jgi:hypothetical protein
MPCRLFARKNWPLFFSGALALLRLTGFRAFLIGMRSV